MAFCGDDEIWLIDSVKKVIMCRSCARCATMTYSVALLPMHIDKSLVRS